MAGMTAANTLARAGHSCCCWNNTTVWAAWQPGPPARRAYLRRLPPRVSAWHAEELPPLLVAADRRLIVQLKNIRFDNPMFSLVTTFDRGDFTRLLTDRFGIPAQAGQEFFDTGGE